MFDDYVVVFKAIGDLIFYVTGAVSENELVLHAALQALFESVSLLLRGQLDKKTALENLDLLLLCVDEVVDAGLILETDPQTVASRVAMRGADSDGGVGAGGAGGAVGSAEQTISQALGTAREMLVRSLAR
jgi:coatomer subunit zeta